jgi:hypothetical protein
MEFTEFARSKGAWVHGVKKAILWTAPPLLEQRPANPITPLEAQKFLGALRGK